LTDGEHLGRRRVPPPMIRRRIASGRGATEQPNAGGDHGSRLTPRFWLMVVLTGVVTGLFADLLMFILFGMQHLAFGYHAGSLQAAVERASDTRRVVPLLVAGVFGGISWYFLRRSTAAGSSRIDDEIWTGEGRLSFGRSFGSSVISEVVIGMGASIGREAAPKLMGGVAGSLLGTWSRLSPSQRRLLVACGGGAGLAAVYNVPLAGALFTVEILLGSLTLPMVLPALACSSIATATAWLYLPNHPTYVGIPSYRFTMTLLVFSILAGPLVGLVASGYIRLIAWVSYHQLHGAKSMGAPLIAFGILALIGIEYPQLFGNGKDIARFAFVGQGGFALLLTLFILKPLVTSLCLGSGAAGGLLTPTLSTGAALGGCLGIAWSLLWHGSPVGAFALVGAAAMIGASMQAPLTAIVLVLELTHAGFAIMVPMLAATVGATAVTRHIDGYSIYSARLSPR
jgi:CIC family chloride channel protein